jgi:hypothetical protein
MPYMRQYFYYSLLLHVYDFKFSLGAKGWEGELHGPLLL